MIAIGYDFQGWAINAMNLREILESLGFRKNDAGEYAINSDNPILDAYPQLLEDDGMAYGVNPQYITEAQDETFDDQISGQDVKVFNIFREPQHDLKEDLDWLKRTYPEETEENND